MSKRKTKRIRGNQSYDYEKFEETSFVQQQPRALQPLEPQTEKQRKYIATIKSHVFT